MSQARSNRKRSTMPSRFVLLLAGILAAVGIAVVIAAVLLGPALKNTVHKRAVQALEQRFKSDVSFQEFDVALFPKLRVTAKGMVFRYKKRTDLPPLIQADLILAEGSLLNALRGHVGMVRLEGLALHVPSKGHAGDDKKPPEKEQTGQQDKVHFSFVVDEMIADGTHLEIIRKQGEKPPLEFEIHRLKMEHVDLNEPAAFHATLSNPKPRGEIESTGKFGPWNGDEPSLTPVSGNYTFTHADLATFKGIGGILSSKGKYDGVLQRIEVDGETETPEFLLDMVRHSMPLHTTFHSIVDGTNGNTWLQPINAKLGNSAFVAKGEVTKVQDEHGRQVLLDVTMDQGRLEDLLRLAVKSDRPPLSGAIQLQAKLNLPPGDQDVILKLGLDGHFDIRAARFSSLDIRERLRGLSRKAQGIPADESAGSSVSNLRGSFHMQDGVINFSELTFEIEGASLHLTGKYTLAGEQLDLHGKLLLDAKLSETTTGAKAFFLKALDPFFHKKNGHGSELPIKITGTRSSPSFGLDIAGKS